MNADAHVEAREFRFFAHVGENVDHFETGQSNMVGFLSRIADLGVFDRKNDVAVADGVHLEEG